MFIGVRREPMKMRNWLHRLTGVVTAAVLALGGAFAAGQVAIAEEASTRCFVGSSTIQQCFPDSALASAIAKAAGTGTGAVFSAPLQKKITKLEAKASGVQSIKGISNLTNLTSVDFSNNSIKDVSEVTSLKNLQTAKFYGNDITDVKPFASLSKLTELGLGDNAISDISSLSALHSLTFVNLAHNNIASISALTGNKGMKYVFAAGNKITDGSPLNQFPDLIGADLSENQIMDVSNITADPVYFLIMQDETLVVKPTIVQGGSVTLQLPKISNGKWATPSEYTDGGSYDASHGTITWSNLTWSKPKPLKVAFMTGTLKSRSNDWGISGAVYAYFSFGPDKLTRSNWRQYLQGNSASSVGSAGTGVDSQDADAISDSTEFSVSEQKSQTATLGAVASADVTNNPVQAPASHSCVSKTFQVCFADSKLAAAVASSLGKKIGDSISSSDVTKLTSVTASGLGVTSLAGLEAFPNLTKLVADNNKISDLSPLASLTSLIYLSLYENKVTDVTPLANLKKLDGLALGGNQISSINALKNLSALHWIDLYGNKISDPSTLGDLTNLVDIWLEGNGISKLPTFSKLSHLAKLQLDWNNIIDMSAASQMSLAQYFTASLQHVNSSSTVNEGGSVSLTTPVDQFGKHMKPKEITPSGGNFDLSTGTVTWKNVQSSGDYSIRFSTSYDHFKYSGQVTHSVTVKHTDTTAPEIVGAYPTKVTVGHDFDPFDSVHASDNVDGDVTDSLSLVQWKGFSTAKAGTSFTLYYSATDKAGNEKFVGRKVDVTTATIQDRSDSETLEVTTEAGAAPKLQRTIHMRWSDGSLTQEYINWNSIDPSLYAKANNFDVYGTARGAKVKAHVTVHQASTNTVVYYKNTAGWVATTLHYRLYKSQDAFMKPSGVEGTVKMSPYCSGWSVATIANSDDAKIQLGFSNSAHWDNAGGWYNIRNSSVYVLAQPDKNVFRAYAGAPTCPAPTTVPVTSVSVSPNSVTLTVGSTKQLSATVSPSNATNKSVTWKSSDAAVATVSGAGLLTARKVGTATITVSSSNGKTVKAVITVIQSVTPVQTTQNMYRLYNPNSGEHFYTAAKPEHDNLVGLGWHDEGIGWVAPTTSDTPVYRLYNPNAGDHHYTMSVAEKDMLVHVGWRDEGIGWYSAENSGRAPLYRQYNPNAKAGAHNYTLSKGENDYLVHLGWHGEGIAWYAIRA